MRGMAGQPLSRRKGELVARRKSGRVLPRAAMRIIATSCTTGRDLRAAPRPAISAFPERVVGSACASSFSRLARRLLALRPAHSRCHQFVARFTQRLQPVRHLPDCSGCFRLEHFAGWALHPLESAALARRTPVAGISVTGEGTCKGRLTGHRSVGEILLVVLLAHVDERQDRNRLVTDRRRSRAWRGARA
jgi:hypothetical protein